MWLQIATGVVAVWQAECTPPGRWTIWGRTLQLAALQLQGSHFFVNGARQGHQIFLGT